MLCRKLCKKKSGREKSKTNEVIRMGPVNGSLDGGSVTFRWGFWECKGTSAEEIRKPGTVKP